MLRLVPRSRVTFACRVVSAFEAKREILTGRGEAASRDSPRLVPSAQKPLECECVSRWHVSKCAGIFCTDSISNAGADSCAAAALNTYHTIICGVQVKQYPRDAFPFVGAYNCARDNYMHTFCGRVTLPAGSLATCRAPAEYQMQTIKNGQFVCCWGNC